MVPMGLFIYSPTFEQVIATNGALIAECEVTFAAQSLRDGSLKPSAELNDEPSRPGL